MADLRQSVYSMLGQRDHLKNSEIGKHFLYKGFKRRKIYDRIKRDEIGLPTKDLPKSDRPTSFNAKKFQKSKKCRCESYRC